MMMSTPSVSNTPSLRLLFKRGFQRQCPQCGEDSLFTGYLKTASQCSSCQLDFEKIRSDDAPAYFTIAIVGHIVVPLLVYVAMYYTLPLYTQFILWCCVTILLTFLLLPRIKGIIMAILWKVKS